MMGMDDSPPNSPPNTRSGFSRALSGDFVEPGRVSVRNPGPVCSEAVQPQMLTAPDSFTPRITKLDRRCRDSKSSNVPRTLLLCSLLVHHFHTAQAGAVACAVCGNVLNGRSELRLYGLTAGQFSHLVFSTGKQLFYQLKILLLI